MRPGWRCNHGLSVLGFAMALGLCKTVAACGDGVSMAKQVKPPRVEFNRHDPLQDYYNDGCGNEYSVAKLADDAKGLPVFDCPLAAISLSGEIWQGCDMHALAWHVRRVNDADLAQPILLDWRGEIADGRHRVIKALALGKRTIKARRLPWRPDPCRKEGS